MYPFPSRLIGYLRLKLSIIKNAFVRPLGRAHSLTSHSFARARSRSGLMSRSYRAGIALPALHPCLARPHSLLFLFHRLNIALPQRQRQNNDMYMYICIHRARGNVNVMAEKISFLTLCTGKLAARFIREIYIFFARVPKGKFLSRANAPGADATEESLDTASYSKKEKFHIGFSEGEAISRRDIDYLSPGSRFVKNRSNRPCDLSSRTLIRCPRMDD